MTLETSNAVLELRKTAIPKGVGHVTQVVCDRAMNSELWDMEGKRYIDFAAGIAVVNTGHNHPKVKAAVLAQLEKFTHTCFHVALYPGYVELADKLNRLVPGDSPKKTMLVSTGAEAVENAIKIARAHTGRSGIIAFNGAFHGRTMMGMALTGKVTPYKAGFGPFPPEVFHAPYPNPYHGVSVENSLNALKALFKVDVDPSRVAAIILEPVQGEGGFNIAPPAFLQGVRKICDEYGILMIVDEIQTGFARTGRMFATEYADIEPDLMTLAKGIAGGYPLSAVTGKADVMDAANIGGLGGTYGGSPLACAAAQAVLEVIEQDNLCARAEEIGDIFVERLKASPHKAHFGDIRNLGAMIAVELVTDGDKDQPNAELTRDIVAAASKNGLILLSCGTNGNVIRFLPPLTISNDLIHEGLDILETCFNDVGPK